MSLPVLSRYVMNRTDATAARTPTASEYSLGQILAASLLVTGAILLAVLAVSAPGVAVSFLAGACTTAVAYKLRRRVSGEARDREVAVPGNPQPRG